MDVTFRLTPQRSSPALVLEAPALTPEMEALLHSLRAQFSPSLPCVRGGETFLLPPDALCLFYAQDKSVFARDRDGAIYSLSLRLYELEDRLDPCRFVRISHSEIVNLTAVTALDLSLSGTIRITLSDGSACYVSRRNVRKIKEALGLVRRNPR